MLNTDLLQLQASRELTDTLIAKALKVGELRQVAGIAPRAAVLVHGGNVEGGEIGRASCRERV